MKTAISIPDPIFAAAERVAMRLGMSRSELYARAVSRFVDAHRDEIVTEALNAVYEEEVSRLDPVLASMQTASLPRERW